MCSRNRYGWRNKPVAKSKSSIDAFAMTRSDVSTVLLSGPKFTGVHRLLALVAKHDHEAYLAVADSLRPHWQEIMRRAVGIVTEALPPDVEALLADVSE